ncbi:aminoacyl-tRNA hydrolase [Lacrimispora amygdalina]|uniref:aminoacyl-tRNA hydrolase n=1 Tax=Lacrimispora amygdalina TaxID=253257 RepID=UPI000BE36965|nr:aminoacyl-tRNA hydrolase [Lacrimispora amygdalina]
MYKQIIIARKDLHMSPGKIAAQVSHASMAFLTKQIRKQSLPYRDKHSLALLPEEKTIMYKAIIELDKDLYEQWICGEYAKTVLQAKNKSKLLKAVELANNIGLKENEDFFLIYDNCHTELTPEENGKTLTCIGFKPMDSEIINQLGNKYHLYTSHR